MRQLYPIVLQSNFRKMLQIAGMVGNVAGSIKIVAGSVGSYRINVTRIGSEDSTFHLHWC